ncbi:hypothetical protein L1987_48479 [Smallanthus sonchifolius]|uniref:Uncharacterized protein n=1 Tax=Smallanthus sonchifolius TaxID=185202 RepID=A0ACB9FS33_9ASTR|nr:hypothetical protein L1987_48479 [Smallanthus sonchifolius]
MGTMKELGVSLERQNKTQMVKELETELMEFLKAYEECANLFTAIDLARNMYRSGEQLIPANPAVGQEISAELSLLLYETRYRLYGEWEKGDECNLMVLSAKQTAKLDTRRILKRLAKENFKRLGRMDDWYHANILFHRLSPFNPVEHNQICDGLFRLIEKTISPAYELVCQPQLHPTEGNAFFAACREGSTVTLRGDSNGVLHHRESIRTIRYGAKWKLVKSVSDGDDKVVKIWSTDSWRRLCSVFTAIGCNILALISRLTTVIGGCISLCNINVSDNTCYGILCCQTNIPPSLKL